MDRSRLKGLYSQRDQVKVKIQKLEKDKDGVIKDLNILQNKLNGIQSGIDKLESNSLVLSSHFLSRYRERVGPGSEEEIRAAIVTPGLCMLMETLGKSGKFPFGEYTLVLEDGILLTITSPDSKKEMKAKYK